jgi:hypothetical protein
MTADDILAREKDALGGEAIRRLNAQLVASVIKCKNQVRNGMLAEKAIRAAFNHDRPDSEKFTSQKLGRMLKALKLEASGTTKNGSAAIVWDQETVDGLSRRFAIPSEAS